MTLGLKRGTIRLVEHQPGWSRAFAEERALLARLLGDSALAIEHVGSTAVPGLAAKPILDIAIAVQTLDDCLNWVPVLKAEGYTAFGDANGWGEHFFAKGPDTLRTIYLHAVPVDSPRWKNYLRFRDILRADDNLRMEYETLKQRAAGEHPADRNAYTEAKDAWIGGLFRIGLR